MDENDREKRMFSKIIKEQEHCNRLNERGMDNLTIADQLIHIMMEVLEEGFKARFPDKDDDFIRLKMRDHVLKMEKIKQGRRSIRNGRI